MSRWNACEFLNSEEGAYLRQPTSWNGRLTQLFNVEPTFLSQKAFDPSEPFAQHLVGAESQLAMGEFNLADFIRECPAKFFEALPILRPEDREILIEYYILKKPQVWIAKIHGKTQTLVWQELQRFGRVIAAGILFGAPPSEDAIRSILETRALERIGFNFRPLLLSRIVLAFQEKGHLQAVASALRLPPPFLRRAVAYAALRLSSSGPLDHRALGDYLSYLVYRVHSFYAPISIERRKKARALRVLRFSDPKILGEYEIDVRRPEFKSLCPSRAAV